MKIVSTINNDNGSIIVAGLMILVLLTVIGLAANNLTTTELQTSTNSLLYERAFYTAEAGLAHAKELLKVKYFVYNEADILSGGSGEWDFALDGTELGAGSVASDTLNDGIPDYEGGVVWINNFDLDGVAYTVTVYNNADDPSCPVNCWQDDQDGLLWVRSDAVGPRGERCSIVELVQGTAVGQAVSGYTAQEGSGSGKTHSAEDAEAIDFGDIDFAEQL